jgi:hypothetical protein
MIKPEKFKGALYALHYIMVQARWMAYQNEESKKIAKLLDWGEILPSFISSSEDHTERFRQYLQAIAHEFPACTHALTIFNEGPPEGW